MTHCSAAAQWRKRCLAESRRPAGRGRVLLSGPSPPGRATAPGPLPGPAMAALCGRALSTVNVRRHIVSDQATGPGVTLPVTVAARKAWAAGRRPAGGPGPGGPADRDLASARRTIAVPLPDPESRCRAAAWPRDSCSGIRRSPMIWSQHGPGSPPGGNPGPPVITKSRIKTQRCDVHYDFPWHSYNL